MDIGRPMLATAVQLCCWFSFFAVWVGAAAVNGRRAPPVIRRARRQLVPPIVFLTLCALLIAEAGHDFWRTVTYRSDWSVPAGIVLLVTGTIVTIWGRWALATMYTASAALREGHILHINGPYGLTRHPIYVGAIGMGAGTALINGMGAWLAGFALFTVFLWTKARTEEHLLTEAFPDDYAEYARRVPFLVPRIRGQPADERQRQQPS